MSSKYVIVFEPTTDKLCEGEKKIENAVAKLLDSKTKTDEQAVRKFKRIKKELKERATHQIRLCKILK
jgi:hypothetical protein